MTSQGIGVRVIQFYNVIVPIPSFGILTLACVIERQVAATLFGTIVGYVPLASERMSVAALSD